MTILPKKKVGKEKTTADPESHEHQSSDSVGGRARLESNQHRNLDERHRVAGRIRSSDLLNVAACSSSSKSPTNNENHDHEINDIEQQKDDVKPQSAVKRRHGRLSPLSQPYTRGKNIRPSSSEPASSAGSSEKYLDRSSPFDRTSPFDRSSTSTPSAGVGRNVRRRQRSRIEDNKNSGNNSDDEYDQSRLRTLHQGINFEKLEVDFVGALKDVRGFYIKEMVEDGACLFRAVADQVYGDQNMNDEVRRHCMDYMMKNCDFFSNFVTEDYVTYIARKRLPHTHGNHLEMQAMAEIYNRNFEVFQYSTEPINTFQSSSINDNEPIRVSYHRNTHYNSVVNPYKATIGVGLGLPSFTPGLADERLLEAAQRESEQELLEQQMLQDKLLAADWENTEQEMLREVANKSFNDYLSHHQKIANQQPSSSCSTSTTRHDEDQQHEPCSSSSSNVVKPAEKTDDTAQTPDQDSSTEQQQETVQQTSDEGAGCSSSQQLQQQQSFMFGIPGQGDWVDESEENTILAQVMAQSHREYYESLSKRGSSKASCSKYT